MCKIQSVKLKSYNGSLPKEHDQFSQPFAITGVENADPFLVKIDGVAEIRPTRHMYVYLSLLQRGQFTWSYRP